jgi:aminoglycoside phosphotransferase (APT) family kinase protein
MRSRIDDLITRVFPGSTVLAARHFGVDEDDLGDATEKGIGYGKPIRITLRDASGKVRDVVLHTATGDQFGHDRRADRAAELLGAFDTFADIPRHVTPVDVGFVDADDHLRSFADCGEPYLLTGYAPGTIYAHDLRELSHGRALSERDRRRAELLADYLAELHVRDTDSEPSVYTRAIRDLVGHGEGIFGLIDGFPADVPSAPPARLQAIEQRCVAWRWKLRGREARLSRTHGDFHPFNILFDDDDRLSLLDAARGTRGDPADDVVCIALNYVFFAAGHDGAWTDKLGALWTRFWDRYLDRTGDDELLASAPPYVAWRGLVMANPTWYPHVTADSRDRLLTLIEETLEQDRFDPALAETIFR